MAPRSAVVLAGGLGTRLRSVVDTVPKPMAPISGRPFLNYLLDYWIEQGIECFVLSVGYRYAIIQEHFGDRYRGCEVRYAVEREPLGTGGGLLLANGQLDPAEEAFLLINGDTYFAVDLARLDRFARQHHADWCLSLFRATEANRYGGVELSGDGRIAALASQRGQLGDLADGGVSWVRRRCLESFPSPPGQALSLESQLLPKLLHEGAKLMGLECSGRFIDIGVPLDYARAGDCLSGVL